MGKVYDEVMWFKRKYPGSLGWRLKKHAKIIEMHLNAEEQPKFVFCGQLYVTGSNDIFTTCIVCLTNKRILIGRDLLVVGYRLNSITPDLFNDMQVYQGLLWGKVTIDTVKENVVINFLDKKCLAEVETAISSFMMEEKQKYQRNEDK